MLNGMKMRCRNDEKDESGHVGGGTSGNRRFHSSHKGVSHRTEALREATLADVAPDALRSPNQPVKTDLVVDRRTAEYPQFNPSEVVPRFFHAIYAIQE